MSPEELDEARAKEAYRQWQEEGGQWTDSSAVAAIAARLAREGWTPPEPVVDPDVLAWREWVVEQWPDLQGDAISGETDSIMPAQAYLAGARMAREQERERAKELVECVERYAGPHAAMAIAKYQGEA